MRVVSFALLWSIFQPAGAVAAQCDPDLRVRVSLCEPPAKEQDLLLAMMGRVVEAHGIFQDSLSQEISLRKTALGKDDPILLGKWKRSHIEAEWQRKRMELYADRVLTAAQRIYGIAPSVASGAVVTGPMAGHPAAWKLRFLYSRSTFRLAKTPDNSEYYIGTLLKAGDGGVTDEDGQVNIGIGAFRLAVKNKNPLILALAVHHEAVHFSELLTRGWDTHEAGEYRVWKETIMAAREMGAAEDDVIGLDLRMADIEQAVRLGEAGLGPLRSPFHSEKIQFEVDFEYEKALMNSQGTEMERKSLSGRLDALRAAAAASSEEAKKDQTLNRMEEEAARCGFKIHHPGNWHRYGFYEEEIPGNRHIGPHYYFARDTGWEEFRVALFLARVCLDEGVNEPCNDGLDIINRRWGKDGFGEGWEIDVNGKGGQQECLDFLQKRLNPPMDVRRIDKEVSRAWRDLRKRWKREGEEAMRRHRQQQAEAQRSRNGRNRDADDSSDERRCGPPNSETGIVGCRSR